MVETIESKVELSEISAQHDVREVSSRQITPSIRLPQNTDAARKLRQYSFIELRLPFEARITLSLFDEEGEEVGTVFNEKCIEAGIHHLTFSPEECAGIPNFYRLIVKGGAKVYIEVKRLQ
jgi:hypothetical protein